MEETKPSKAEGSEVMVEIGSSRIVVREETAPELLSKVIKVLVELC